MQFTISAAALMAFVSTVVAQVANFDVISAPGNFEVVEPGKPYTIVWEPSPAEYDAETISIILLGGSSQKTLIPDPEPVAAGVVNSAGTFKWNVPATLGDDAIYGLRIQLDSDETVFQYSFPFHIGSEGGSGGNSTETPIPSGTKTSTSKSAAPTNSGNSTTTAAPPKTTIVTTTSVEDESKPTAVPTESVVPESGATRSAAGAVAILGGLAIAAFGL